MSADSTKVAKMPLLAGLNHTREDLNKTTEVPNIDVVTPEKPASPWDLQLKKIGPYKITKVIGFGGVGTVFEAHDTNINRPVALKVLNRKWIQDEVAKERFLREARLCAMIKSPHVAMIHSVGDDNGVPYLAMELLSGFSLEQLIHQVNLTMAQIIRLAREMSKGLSAAHLQGLIHRDIKPANIWLETLADPSGGDKKVYRVKILDFGLARLEEQNNEGLTRHGVVVGTPMYMSPEQATGVKIDARSDLFSLGVVLYQLCTKQLPFQGESVADIMSAICKDSPTPVREINPEVPAKLSRLIERLMSKSPSQRPPDAQNVTRLLEIIEVEEEKRILKQMGKGGSGGVGQSGTSNGQQTMKVTAEIHPLVKWLLMGSLAMNLFLMIVMAMLIYLLFSRH